jgi:hypothetical protein
MLPKDTMLKSCSEKIGINFHAKDSVLYTNADRHICIQNTKAVERRTNVAISTEVHSTKKATSLLYEVAFLRDYISVGEIPTDKKLHFLLRKKLMKVWYGFYAFVIIFDVVFFVW